MKIIRVSPQWQITIPKDMRHFCPTKEYGAYLDGNKLVLRPVETTIIKSEDEILEEMIQQARLKSSIDD